MKLISFLFPLLFLCSGATPLSSEESRSCGYILSDINSQWILHPEAVPESIPAWGSDIQNIQFHLILVEQYLREHRPAELSSQQLHNRHKLLDSLHLYALNGLFPTNTFHSERQPYFIDVFGVPCAVGKLIIASGHEEIALQINEKQNYAYIKEIRSEALLNWATEHGFTVDELAWIQPAYSPSTKVEPVGKGTNGPIDRLEYSPADGSLLIQGRFDSLGGAPCDQLGRYFQGNLECVGSGLMGTINDVGYDYSSIVGFSLVVAGDFQDGGSSFPLAKFQDSTSSWVYESIPEIGLCVGEMLYRENSMMVSRVSFPNRQEYWKEESGVWNHKATFYGEVNDIEESDGLIFVGAFDSVTVFLENDLVTLAAKNIIKYDRCCYPNYEDTWSEVPGEVSDTLLFARKIGFSSLVVGGTCHQQGSIGSPCLSRYLNGSLQTLFSRNLLQGSSSTSIHDAVLLDETRLLVVGDFQFAPFVGDIGYHGLTYDLVWSAVSGYALFDRPVNQVVSYNSNIYFGGEFTIHGSPFAVPLTPLNHLSKLLWTTGLEDGTSAWSFSVSPNPSTDHLSIKVEPSWHISSVDLIDIRGQRIKSITPTQGVAKIDIEVMELPAGVYLLTVTRKDGLSQTQKVMIQ